MKTTSFRPSAQPPGCTGGGRAHDQLRLGHASGGQLRNGLSEDGLNFWFRKVEPLVVGGLSGQVPSPVRYLNNFLSPPRPFPDFHWPVRWQAKSRSLPSEDQEGADSGYTVERQGFGSSQFIPGGLQWMVKTPI